VSPTCVCEKDPPAYLQEEDIARRWWAVSPGTCLPLSNGESCQLLYPGRPGGSHGPDVRDAVLRFTSRSSVATAEAGQDTKETAGDVEIHIRASDWFVHQHHTDVRYNNVMLHVVLICDDTRPTLRQDGIVIPNCSLNDLPRAAHQPAQWPCHLVMARMNEEERMRLFRLAGMLRFEQKMHTFLALVHDAQPSAFFSAYDVCLIPALAEGLGYGRDRAFFRAAGLHLLGLANTVPEPLGRAPEPSPLDANRLHILHNLVAQWRTTGAWQTLRQALAFSQVEQSRVPRGGSPLAGCGVSPQFPPHPRRGEGKKARIEKPCTCACQATTLQKLRAVFAGLGQARTDIIICNIVLPFAAAVAQHENDTVLARQAQNLYTAYPGLPSNQVTRAMCKQLLLKSEPQGACQQQGLHYIYAQACREKRCSQCIIGRQMYE
jgi:Protein of unknown function (DUF2851)